MTTPTLESLLANVDAQCKGVTFFRVRGDTPGWQVSLQRTESSGWTVAICATLEEALRSACGRLPKVSDDLSDLM